LNGANYFENYEKKLPKGLVILWKVVYSRSCGTKTDYSRDLGETPSRGAGLHPVFGACPAPISGENCPTGAASQRVGGQA